RAEGRNANNILTESPHRHRRRPVASNGFRSGQNWDLTGDRPTFVDSSVRSVWIWRYPIDSPVTASVGPKKQSVDVGSRSWSDRSGRFSLSQISEKSRSGTRASQDRLGFYYVDVDVTHAMKVVYYKIFPVTFALQLHTLKWHSRYISRYILVTLITFLLHFLLHF